MDSLTIILDLMKQKGVTDKEFEIDLEFNRSSVNDWKAGRTKTYLKKLSQIANYFKVSTDYLLGNDEKKSPVDMTRDEALNEIIRIYQDSDPATRAAMEAFANKLKNE